MYRTWLGLGILLVLLTIWAACERTRVGESPANISYGYTPLHWAAMDGNADKVRGLLDQGADPNAATVTPPNTFGPPSGETPLHLAAENGHIQVIKLLLNKGADVDSQDSNKDTPLCRAVRNKHVNAVVALIHGGAHVSGISGSRVPLPFAVGNQDLQTAKLLLTHGADVKKDSSILPVAAFYGDEKMVALLLQEGAHINAREDNGSTAVLNASLRGVWKLVGFLLSKGANPNIPDCYGNTPLHAAACSYWRHRETDRNASKVAESLIAYHSSINPKNNNGYTPLYQAAIYGRQDVIPILRRHGGIAQGVHAAVGMGDMGKVKELLKTNPKLVSARDQDEDTPLHVAAYVGNTAIAKMLLSNKADIEAANRNGDTPLCEAATRGKSAMAGFLISMGANVNARAQLRNTPLLCAIEADRLDMAEYLLSHGADVNKISGDRLPLSAAANASNPKMVELLLSHGADVNGRDTQGRTALHILASVIPMSDLVDDKATTAKVLVEHGAKVNIQDKEGKTPLFHAAENGDTSLVRSLLDHGAKTQIVDNGGNIPLCYAKNAAIVRMLSGRSIMSLS